MTNQIIRHLDGYVLYECEAETFREAVGRAVREEVSLEGADLRGAYLRGSNLVGANLSGAYLSDANLSDANLSDANLSGAYLSDANLSDANLSGADLEGANLAGAYLSGADLIDAGQDSRGYRFVGTATDGVRVLGGCRWFTLDEARDHWRTNPEAGNKVAAIAAEAVRRGWIQ